MLAVLATLGLFVVWSAVGLAALVALRADLTELRVALTAPMLGTALTVIPLFVVSNAGVSMHAGAPPVLIVLLVAGVIVLAIRRPRLSLTVVPVVVLCLLELVLVGRPMFRFGFDWLANANGDMAYYVLSATHLMSHGLQSAIDFNALADNRGFSNAAQVLNLRGLRPGSQVTLAGLASSTGRPPVALYMPMSIAIAMSTICATGALAMQAARQWWCATLAAGLLVVSPLTGYGILQQLLPQGWGLGLAAALFAWLMRPELHENRRPRLSDVIVISILTAALFIVGYEVASSLVLAYVAYVAILLVRRRVSLQGVVLLWGAPILVTVVIVNTFLSRAIHYLTHYVLNFGTSEGFHGLTQFGYAIVPDAIAGAAGFRSLFAPPPTAHMSLYILLAVGFFVGVLVAAVVSARSAGRSRGHVADPLAARHHARPERQRFRPLQAVHVRPAVPRGDGRGLRGRLEESPGVGDRRRSGGVRGRPAGAGVERLRRSQHQPDRSPQCLRAGSAAHVPPGRRERHDSNRGRERQLRLRAAAGSERRREASSSSSVAISSACRGRCGGSRCRRRKASGGSHSARTSTPPGFSREDPA